jgi:hypothetical protein
MPQLAQDYYAKNIPLPPVVEPPSPPIPVPPAESPTPPSAEAAQGGVWYGPSPPISSQAQTLWLNSNNNLLYVYDGNSKVWSQLGTNW